MLVSMHMMKILCPMLLIFVLFVLVSCHRGSPTSSSTESQQLLHEQAPGNSGEEKQKLTGRNLEKIQALGGLVLKGEVFSKACVILLG